MQDPEICLITKDPQSEYKVLLESKNARHLVSKVIGVTKLRNKFKLFEAKRQLCAMFDIFLADERVIPTLAPILGKEFFAKKKQPVPVNLKRSNLAAEIEKAANSTYIHFNRGNCNAIKIGLVSHSAKEIAENIMSALPVIFEKVPGKKANIQSIHLKTSDSIALPIYNSLPEEQEK